MPFIPHTPQDIQAMLKTLGEDSIEALFDEIPQALRIAGLPDIPEGVSEQTIDREVNERLATNKANALGFIGAGAYEHHIPAAVWDIAGRGEFLTAYTPYQAEASQGTLQLIYEYQTMMAKLTGMDVANASLYDGATALAEAILMACRLLKSDQHKVLLPSTVHPNYRRTVTTIVNGVTLCDLPYQSETGAIDFKQLEQHADASMLVIQQPNFFGALETVDKLTDWAHAHQMLVVAVVNPTALAILKEPGQWGEQGADIVCGEGQPLGVPLSGGGPYFGFLTCRQKFVRQMPGRIAGRTQDGQGNTGFTLTLQAREQHIRRGKATSNICTNQGLLVTATTIYLSLLGSEGLARVASACHHNTQQLVKQLTTIPGVSSVFSGSTFHEAVIQLNRPVDTVLTALAEHGIHGGYALGKDYPELDNCLLVCATETKTADDLTRYQHALTHVLEGL